jgi:hypothetical protein
VARPLWSSGRRPARAAALHLPDRDLGVDGDLPQGLWHRDAVVPVAENSLFTRHVLAGLQGSTPGPGGVVGSFDLFRCIQPWVTEAQPNQHPVFKAEGAVGITSLAGGTEP